MHNPLIKERLFHFGGVPPCTYVFTLTFFGMYETWKNPNCYFYCPHPTPANSPFLPSSHFGSCSRNFYSLNLKEESNILYKFCESLVQLLCQTWKGNTLSTDVSSPEEDQETLQSQISGECMSPVLAVVSFSNLSAALGTSISPLLMTLTSDWLFSWEACLGYVMFTLNISPHQHEHAHHMHTSLVLSQKISECSYVSLPSIIYPLQF